MSLSINTKTYSADSYESNTVGYNGPSKSAGAKDDLRLSRTAPKPTTVFSGVGRTSAKLTRTLTLTNAKTPTGDLIVEIAVSVPVGFAAADVDAALNDMGAFLASASFKTHVKTPQISF